MRGRKARENIRRVHGLGELGIRHFFHVVAENDFFRVDADFGADLARDEIVVAGQHLDGDAVLAQNGNGFFRAVFGRIEKGEIAGQDEVFFIGLGIRCLRADFLIRNREHTETVAAQIVDLLDEVADENRLHRENFAVAFKVRAFGEHRFRRALGQHLALTVGTFNHHGHHAARKIERDFVRLDIFVHGKFMVQLRVFQHGAVEHIFQARLEMADEIGVAQHLVAFLFEDVAMNFEDDVVNRERAGLVGAEHVHRAEVLDGVESLDDDFFLRHRERALGKTD